MARALSTSLVRTNLQFLGGRATEGGGWSRGWGLAPCQPCVSVPTSTFWVVGPGRQWLGPCQPPLSVPTSSFWVAARQNVGVGPEAGGWRRVNRVCLYQPLVSGWQGHDGSGPGPVNLPCSYQPPVFGWPRDRMWGLVQNLGVGAVSTACVCTNLHFLGGRATTAAGQALSTSLVWTNLYFLGGHATEGGVDHGVRLSQPRFSGRQRPRRGCFTTYQERCTRAMKVRCAPCVAPPRPCPAAARPAPPHG